jgi:hypothetical protein
MVCLKEVQVSRSARRQIGARLVWLHGFSTRSVAWSTHVARLAASAPLCPGRNRLVNPVAHDLGSCSGPRMPANEPPPCKGRVAASDER